MFLQGSAAVAEWQALFQTWPNINESCFKFRRTFLSCVWHPDRRLFRGFQAEKGQTSQAMGTVTRSLLAASIAILASRYGRMIPKVIEVFNIDNLPEGSARS